MKTHHKEIIRATTRIVSLIKTTDEDIMEKILIYNSILKKLPRTTLVDKDCLASGAIFKGITHLYPEAYFTEYSPEKKRKLSIASIFIPEDKAEIHEGWYDGEILFEGNWIEALKVILEMMSLAEIGMTEKEKNALTVFSEALN